MVAYRFDQGENPVEIASLPRKPTSEETAEVADFARQTGCVRWCASRDGWCMWRRGCWQCRSIAGLVYLIGWAPNVRNATEGVRCSAGEPTSWALLVCMIDADCGGGGPGRRLPARFRGGPAGGARPPRAEAGGRPTSSQPRRNSRKQRPQVDWAAQLSPRGGETRIGDNLKFIIDKERGGPIAAVVLFTDGGNNARQRLQSRRHGGSRCADSGLCRRPRLRQAAARTCGSSIWKRPSASIRATSSRSPATCRRRTTAAASVTVELLSGGGRRQRTKPKKTSRRSTSARPGKVVPIKFELKPEEQGVRQYKLARAAVRRRDRPPRQRENRQGRDHRPPDEGAADRRRPDARFHLPAQPALSRQGSD